MPAPLVIAGAALAAGALGAYSQKKGNEARRKEADKNRQFQERMRNTEWQAAVKDMELAGLNPALAYSQGGASSPSGSVAQVENVGDKAVGTAMAVKMQNEQLGLIKAQKESAMVQAAKTSTEVEIMGLQKMINSARLGFLFEDGTMKPKQPMMNLLQAEQAQTLANSARSVSELNLSTLRGPQAAAMAKLFEQIGGSGAGIQQFMPLFLAIIRAGGR